MKIKVMTYNIAGGRDYTADATIKVCTPSACAGVIKKHAPDIVGLNEVDYMAPRSGNIDLAGEVAKIAGFKEHFFARATDLPWGGKFYPYGNAFISNYPIVEKEAIIVPDPEDKSEPTYYETRGICRTLVDFDGTKVEVLTTHFGLAKTEQAESVKLICEMVKNRKYPIILMGDFNVHYHDEQKERIAPIFEIMTDTYKFCEDQTMRTFPSRFNIPNVDDGSNNGGKGIKIDYMFVTDEFKVNKVEIPVEAPSDHIPYIAELEI